MFGGWAEILLVLGIVLLLFGAAKIPQLMKGAGQGVAEFTREVNKSRKPEEDQSEQENRQ